MWKTLAIVAAVASVFLALPVHGQSSSDLDAQWRVKISPDKANGYSLASLREALKIAEKFGYEDPRLFETLVRLAAFCGDDFDECEEEAPGFVSRALKMRSKVKPKDAHYAELLMDLGGATDAKESLGVYREALDVRENLFGAEDQLVAETYAAIASAYRSMNDMSQARRTMQYALEIRERVHKEKTAGYADLLDDSARIYASAKDPLHFQSDEERAIAIRQRLWGQSDPRFVSSLKRIADENQFGENKAFTEKLYRRIVETQMGAHTEKSEAYYSALADLANFLRNGKRFAEAQDAFERAFSVREKMGKRDVTAAYCMENIARVRMSRGMYQDAVQAGEASLQIRAHLEKPSERDIASVEALLAEACLRAHDGTKSETHFRALNNQVGPLARFNLIDTAEKLSTIYQERGDYPQAAAKLETAVAAIEADDAGDARLPQQELKLAQLYQKMGRANDANRMNMAVLRSMGQKMKKQGSAASLKYILIGAVVIFLVLPFVGTATFALLFAWSARRMDRKLTLLFLPRMEAAKSAEQIQPLASEPAYVGGFLGLTPTIESEVMAVTAVATEVAPVIEVLEPTGEIPAPSVSQVTLRADGSDLFAMRVLNLLLSLLTLGIYSFWGKAKVRRYVCGQADYQGDWFAFHGTGRELLLGWLRALPALAFIFLFPTLLPLFWQHRAAPYVAQLSAVGALLLLWPIARVGAYRYRLNRMSWRAIRFSYRGKALQYLGESIAGCLLSVITLGIYVPFFQIRLRRMLLNRTYFGDRSFHFPGRGSDLFPAWLFALPLTVCSLGIGWAWWRALSHRYCWANTTFAGARFRCTATGGKLLWLWVGNFLVIVPTLGLGMSWAMLRTLRFWTKHVQLVHEPELVSIQQDARAATAVGESFADFLGFDFGF
jgi:uncharacterized membrane protein YjgN (DUF898 family)/tetratricopeptide (TPR) repeat protein